MAKRRIVRQFQFTGNAVSTKILGLNKHRVALFFPTDGTLLSGCFISFGEPAADLTGFGYAGTGSGLWIRKEDIGDMITAEVFSFSNAGAFLAGVEISEVDE